MWPNLVRHLFWVQEIAGSNPVTPTLILKGSRMKNNLIHTLSSEESVCFPAVKKSSPMMVDARTGKEFAEDWKRIARMAGK